jgi:hypothetical protein
MAQTEKQLTDQLKAVENDIEAIDAQMANHPRPRPPTYCSNFERRRAQTAKQPSASGRRSTCGDRSRLQSRRRQLAQQQPQYFEGSLAFGVPHERSDAYALPCDFLQLI